MLRERLLATLSVFFATVALLLAGIGLYGVLNYAVIQQRHEMGIRMALGATALHIVRRVTRSVLAMVSLGVVIGLTAGVGFARVVEPLLFHVKATDPATLMSPILILAGVAVIAAFAPAIRAARIDPARTLRAE
jgi:ABC-type antimicrobial peptide transport system permease subunit